MQRGASRPDARLGDGLAQTAEARETSISEHRTHLVARAKAIQLTLDGCAKPGGDPSHTTRAAHRNACLRTEPGAATSMTHEGAVLRHGDTPRAATTVSTLRTAVTRLGPGTTFPLVETLARGRKLTVVARNTAGGWLMVADGAWIATFLVSSAPGHLPVMDVPTSPDFAGICPTLHVAGLGANLDPAAAMTIAHLTTEIRDNPGRALGYYNRGTLHLQTGRYIEALTDLDRALALAPDLAEAYNNRGLAYYEQSALKQAAANFQKASELRPDLAQAYFNRANVYYLLNHFPQAIAAYDRAITLQPNYPRAFMHRGSVRAILGDLAAAFDDLNQAIALDPENAEAYYNRGVAYVSAYASELAIQDFTRAIDLNPEYVAAHFNLSVLQFLQQESEVSHGIPP